MRVLMRLIMQPMVGLVEAWVEELGGTKTLVEVEGTLVVSLVAMGTMMILRSLGSIKLRIPTSLEKTDPNAYLE